MTACARANIEHPTVSSAKCELIQFLEPSSEGKKLFARNRVGKPITPQNFDDLTGPRFLMVLNRVAQGSVVLHSAEGSESLTDSA